jgi:hypothetical protein
MSSCGDTEDYTAYAPLIIMCVSVCQERRFGYRQIVVKHCAFTYFDGPAVMEWSSKVMKHPGTFISKAGSAVSDIVGRMMQLPM